jgi:hypothetical protein
MSQRRKTLFEPIENVGEAPPTPAHRQTMAEPAVPQESAAPPPAAAAHATGDNAPRTDSAPSLGTPLDCEIYRPTQRAPIGLLVILDDGDRKEGEHYRLRADRTVLGRDAGDITIPNDRLMSGTHAELVREFDRGNCRWRLRDLDSTNGTFVRFAKSTLKHGQEFIIGSKRYTYKQARQPAPEESTAADPPQPGRQATMGWQAVSPEMIQDMYPSLVETLPSGEDGPTHRFNGDEMRLGADPVNCSLVIREDPFVSKIHATINKTQSGNWVIKDASSVNGLWLRITNLPLTTQCEFLLGEQRFAFHPF